MTLHSQFGFVIGTGVYDFFHCIWLILGMAFMSDLNSVTFLIKKGPKLETSSAAISTNYVMSHCMLLKPKERCSDDFAVAGDSSQR